MSITNKGISTIPTFTLGKPAIVFDMSVRNGGLSFEPQLKFALEGKPWAFVFWWRYRLVEGDRFMLRLGANPVLSFKTSSIPGNGGSDEAIVARRFLATEIRAGYSVSRNVRIEVYYLYSRGLERSTTKNTHYISLGTVLPGVEIAGGIVVSLSPQVYYLRTDNTDGYYFTYTVSLRKTGWPVYLTSLLNKSIQTHISENSDILWNVSMAYLFDL